MSNQQIVLSQNQKSSTVTLIFQNADFLAAVGDSLRVESIHAASANQLHRVRRLTTPLH